MTFRKSGLTWIVLLLSVTLSGCISRWTEDVELGDGTIIKVTRTEKYGAGGGLGESCLFCTFNWAHLSFEYNGKRYRWKSLPLSEVPMIVDVVDGKPIVISHSASVYCPKKEKNTHSYSFYVYSVNGGGGWVNGFDRIDGALRMRNLHWFKPGYGSGLSVSEKKSLAIRNIEKRSSYRESEIYVAGDQDKHCVYWE